MRYRTLGSGTGVPRRDRAGPSHLVTVGGETWLMDLGPGALARLGEAGLSYDAVDRVFFTHYHVDHVADLAPLLFAARNFERRDDSRPLRIAGPPGLHGLLEGLSTAHGAWILEPHFPLEVEELSDRPLSGSGWTLAAVPMAHGPNAVGYRLDVEGEGTLAYTGDTGVCDGAAALGRGADLFVVECALPDDEALDNHLTPSRVGDLVAAADPGEALLVHLYPALERWGLARAVERIRRAWPGRVRASHDLLEVEIGGT
jgi:ribonuclease BN (tRNA processing enzyme)